MTSAAGRLGGTGRATTAKARTTSAAGSGGGGGRVGVRATRAAAGVTARAVGKKARTTQAIARGGGSGIAQKPPASASARYPSTLPCPQQLTITPAERRALDSPQYPTYAQTKERYRRNFERVVWPRLNAAKAQVFRDWWESTLIYGGAWFRATWPTNQGLVEIERHFLEAPRWEYTAGGFWRISALLETRAEGSVPEYPSADPFLAFVTLLMHFDGDFSDATGNHTPVAEGTGPAVISSTSPKFGSGSVDLNAAASNQVRIDTNATKLSFAGDYTIEGFVYFLDLTGTQILYANDSGTQLRYLVWNLSANRLRYITPAGGVIDSGLNPFVINTWHHVAVTRSGTTVRVFIDGTVVATTAGDASGAGALTRVTIGGANALFGSGNRVKGRMDEWRVTNGVARYTANFTPPTEPFLP